MNETKNYPEALKYYTQSIQTSKSIGDLRLIGIGQLNLCNIYAIQLNYPKAIELLLDAKENFIKSGFTRGVQICINNLGAINLRPVSYTHLDVYKRQQYADQLVNAGFAYYAFDTPEELEQMRAQYKTDENPSPQYNHLLRAKMRNSLTLSEAEVAELLAAGCLLYTSRCV